MDRLERLINLVAGLLDAEQPLTREEIRVRVGGYAADDDAFRRNFERDKDLLRQMGIPVALEPLDPRQPEGPAGYRIPRDRYELADPGLDPDELAALHLAASAVDVEGAWGRNASMRALWKLAGAGEAASGAGQVAATRLDPSVAELPGGQTVAALFGAVADHRAVQFGYRGRIRHVDPWRLSYRNGQWYLAGFDHDRQESRTFRLDRIESTPEAVGAPGAFERPEAERGGPPPPWLLGEDEPVEATLVVDASQGEWAVGAVGEDAVVERRPDGAVVLSVPVTNRDAFRSFVLGFLDHAEVLGPPTLRADLVRWLRAVATAGAA